MKWLNDVVDKIEAQFPEGEIVVSSGVSPSGTYHLGTLREVLTAEAIMYEAKKRGRQAQHIHVVDDLDVFRKVPSNVPAEYEKYLGMPLCDIPSPDGQAESYADFYLQDLLVAAKDLNLEMEVMRAHEKYRSGFFTSAIETALNKVPEIRRILEDISGNKLGEEWSPVQVIEDGYLKNREFVSIDNANKTITYKDKDGQERQASYDKGQVKLNWRIDWPARWSLLGVRAEPFGRDHATKGGSYDTGCVIVKDVFDSMPPIPMPYDFVNRTGDTKKMSKSAGNTITASELLTVLPPEVVWFFIVRYSPDKLLFFDENVTLIRLMDEFGELLAKPDKTKDDEQLIDLCLHGIEQPTVSRVPFSHLVASYQASLKDVDKTLEVIKRSEYETVVDEDSEIIRAELRYIDEWLKNWAPDEAKFELVNPVDFAQFDDKQKAFFGLLAGKITNAPEDADGSWFHTAIYDSVAESEVDKKDSFSLIYRLLIGKTSGPRAGWFMSILPRDWLIDRLTFRG